MTEIARHSFRDGLAAVHEDSRVRVDRFIQLLQGPAPLVLPSAWDAGTARLADQCGASAVAVSAAGVSWTLGGPNAHPLHTQDLLAVCERVCRAVGIPVIIDMRDAPSAMQELPAILEVLACSGVVGLTLPNTRRPGDLGPLRDRVRGAGIGTSAPLYVMAHVEAEGTSRSRLRDTLRRARAYVEAGADSVLVTGLDWAEVVTLVRELPVPLGVDVSSGWAPPVHLLARAGVRCVALGIGPLRAAVSALRGITNEAQERGSYDIMDRALASCRTTGDLE